jgi:hypothetical protein
MVPGSWGDLGMVSVWFWDGLEIVGWFGHGLEVVGNGLGWFWGWFVAGLGEGWGGNGTVKSR